MEANREFRGIFEENSQEIFSLMKKGLRQPGPRPIMLLGWIANGLKLWALVVFFDNPTPTGLVDAAWLYIIAQLLVFVVTGVLGWINGRRQGRFFNTLSETEQRQLVRMVLCEQALEGYRGISGLGPQRFLDWHQTVIKDMLKKKTEQADFLEGGY